jgi:PAS domain S-box-containing protein
LDVILLVVAAAAPEVTLTDRKPEILLVDDRAENIMVLRATLSSLDVTMVDANSGREALKLLLDREFAVILLDVMMPEIDGFETARLIREREKSRLTPIIFITAMSLNDADAFKGYSVGAVDYIMKPFVPDILRSKVSVFVDLFKKTEELKRQQDIIRQIEQREYQAKLRETTQRMEAETEIVRTEHRAVRAMVQHAPMGFARLGAKQVVTDLNPVFAEQYGLPHENVIGVSLKTLVPWLPEQIFQAVERNEPFHFQRLRLESNDQQDDQRERFCDLATWPITDANGQSNGNIMLSVDATERVQLDQQRSDFVATLAHDLQTPVIASDRALALLLDKASKSLSPDLLNLVSMLKKNNQNLLHMIESLLDVYHYEEGARALYFDDVDMRLLASTCIEELTALADEQGVILTSRLPRRAVIAKADRTAIRRVLTNLLDNAIKFTPRGGTIEVAVAAENDEVLLEVTDSGVGVPPEDLQRLFDRYWHGRGHKTYKASSGLGLYLCQQIVDAHKGRIEVESEVGKMTTFKVYLPIVQRDIASEAAAQSTAKTEAS